MGDPVQTPLSVAVTMATAEPKLSPASLAGGVETAACDSPLPWRRPT